jgi:hypothetical protein
LDVSESPWTVRSDELSYARAGMFFFVVSEGSENADCYDYVVVGVEAGCFDVYYAAFR